MVITVELEQNSNVVDVADLVADVEKVTRLADDGISRARARMGFCKCCCYAC